VKVVNDVDPNPSDDDDPLNFMLKVETVIDEDKAKEATGNFKSFKLPEPTFLSERT
jgi:hypothetical protein